MSKGVETTSQHTGEYGKDGFMVSGSYGDVRYTQVTRAYQTAAAGRDQAAGKPAAETARSYGSDSVKNSASEKTACKEWKPLSKGSPLIPTQKTGYGTVIGDVELSDKAKEYYAKLKSRFHNMDFILVGSREKAQVAANAAAYGNASRQVVLIDEEKLERMATDESFRKKYEGIIAMSETKLQEAKNSLASSGASVKNFGMSVDANGNTSFFATIAKNTDAQEKIVKKRLETKKHDKIRAEKAAAKKNAEKIAARRKDGKEEQAERIDRRREEYLELRADSMEELLSKVSSYAYEQSAGTQLSEQEEQIGQNIDFKG